VREFRSRTCIRQLLGLDSLLFCHQYLFFFGGSLLVALAVLPKKLELEILNVFYFVD